MESVAVGGGSGSRRGCWSAVVAVVVVVVAVREAVAISVVSVPLVVVVPLGQGVVAVLSHLFPPT